MSLNHLVLQNKANPSNFQDSVNLNQWLLPEEPESLKGKVRP